MNETANENSAEMSVEDVTQYLKNNLDFFQHNPGLLLMMKLDEQPNGSVSLVERQLIGLRKRQQDTEEELQQVVKNAQDNQQLLQQTIQLTLNLISCESTTSFVETLGVQLEELFEIKHHRLLLNKEVINNENSFTSDMSEVTAVLGDNFPHQQVVCGRLKEKEKEILFTDPEDVNSAAILPLGQQGELGLLVLGSNDETHFDPEKGDLFLLLIADMASRLIYRLSK